MKKTISELFLCKMEEISEKYSKDLPELLDTFKQLLNLLKILTWEESPLVLLTAEPDSEPLSWLNYPNFQDLKTNNNFRLLLISTLFKSEELMENTLNLREEFLIFLIRED